MQLRLNALFVWPLDAVVDAVLKTIVLERFEPSIDPEQVAGALRWDASEIIRLFEHQTAPDLGGPIILSMTFDEIAGLSQLRTKLHIEAGLIAAVSAVWRVNRLARLLMRSEWDIRRMQTRAIGLGLLCRTPSGRLRRIRRLKHDRDEKNLFMIEKSGND